MDMQRYLNNSNKTITKLKMTGKRETDVLKLVKALAKGANPTDVTFKMIETYISYKLNSKIKLLILDEEESIEKEDHWEVSAPDNFTKRDEFEFIIHNDNSKGTYKDISSYRYWISSGIGLVETNYKVVIGFSRLLESVEDAGWNDDEKQQLAYILFGYSAPITRVDDVIENYVNYQVAETFKVEAYHKLIKLYEDSFYQVNFELTAENLSKATANEDKKNVNKSTKLAMKNSELNNQFSKVEFDNEVDLDKEKQFETKVIKTMAKYGFAKVCDSKPELRLRKIKNHNASGLYFPDTNTITLEFRGENAGKAFVHEYGHYIDYQKQEKALSMMSEFNGILRKYQSVVDELDLQKKDYYKAPTEVFARAFEFYMSNKGVDKELVGNVDEKEYTPFQGMESEISQYFESVIA